MKKLFIILSLLLSLSYSQPDTLWTKVFDETGSGVSLNIFNIQSDNNGLNIFMDVTTEDEFDYTPVSGLIELVNIAGEYQFSEADIDLNGLDEVCWIGMYGYFEEFFNININECLDFDFWCDDNGGYFEVPWAICETEIFRNFDIIEITSDGQIESVNHYGPTTEEYENCIYENEDNLDCIPSIINVSKPTSYNASVGSIVGILNGELWIKSGNSEYLCEVPPDFSDLNLKIQDSCGASSSSSSYVVIASNQSMAKFYLSNDVNECHLLWQSEFAQNGIDVETYSIAEIIPTSYGVVGRTGNWDIGYDFLFSRIDNNGNLETEITIGELNELADTGNVIKTYNSDNSEVQGIFMSGLQLSSDYQIKKSVFYKITYEGELIFEYFIEDYYIRDFLITENNGFIFIGYDTSIGNHFVKKFNNEFIFEWELNLTLKTGIEYSSSYNNGGKIFEYNDSYIVALQDNTHNKAVVIAFEEEVYGCTDSNSSLYNPEANVDDGTCFVLGDVNADGELNILDVVLGINIILEMVEYTDAELAALDFNGDGDSNIIDLVQMVGAILNGI